MNTFDNLLVLARFSEGLSFLKEQENIFDRIVDGVMEIVGCCQASLMLFDVKAKKLQWMITRGFKRQNYSNPRIKLTKNVARWLDKGGEVLALAEPETQKFLILFDRDEKNYFDCELRIPFYARGQLVGVLNLGKKTNGTEYGSGELMLLQVLINISTIAIENVMDKSKNPPVRGDHSEDIITRPSVNISIKRTSRNNELIGQSKAIIKINEIIDKVAANDVTVLVTGESGTGKEVVARAIHRKSLRSKRPLITMNCAALPENLVESELFGHQKGAFTGAHLQKQGKFEVAHGATLFLDEIGDMSLRIQAKVLRVLQEGTFERIGSNRTQKVDVRIIAATNRDLVNEIKLAKFREDLFYRINVVQIHLPPLRERREDIPLMVDYFFNFYNKCYNKNLTGIEKDTMEQLIAYDFPGNVRELAHLIERAVILETTTMLTSQSLPVYSACLSKLLTTQGQNSLQELEKDHIKTILASVNYNKSRAAKILGIARKTLREKIEKYSLAVVQNVPGVGERCQ